MTASKKELQRMYKGYLKALLKETDLEKRDYLQHQLKNLRNLILKTKERER